MKKTLFVIIGIFVLIILILLLVLIGIKSKNKELQKINAQYEFYLNKEIYGTELATLINRAVDNNKKMEVEKDENGFYIDNGKDSIIITISMIGMKDTIQMEKISAARNETICKSI